MALKAQVSVKPTQVGAGNVGVKRVVGTDLGFVQTKTVWGAGERERCKYSSLVKRRSEVATEGLEDSEGYVISCDTGVWNVGSKGTFDFTAERLTKDSDLPKLLTSFGLLNRATAVSFIDLLVSGLPVAEFGTYREQFKEALEGTFHFGFGNARVVMNVREALVIPQSAGAFYDFGLTDTGEIREEPLLSEDVLVLDIGGRTSDGCIMEKSKYSQDSFTIVQGVWKVQNELRKLIARKYRFTLQPAEVDAVLRSGMLKLGGSEEDVSDLVTKAVETVFPSVRDELSLYVEDFRRFSAILLAGGGGYVYHDYIADFAKVPTILLPDAEYSNANGYRKYGLLKLGA